MINFSFEINGKCIILGVLVLGHIVIFLLKTMAVYDLKAGRGI